MIEDFQGGDTAFSNCLERLPKVVYVSDICVSESMTKHDASALPSAHSWHVTYKSDRPLSISAEL
jgi:hypothetical protein